MSQTQIVVSLGPGHENALRFIRFRHPDSILIVVPTNLKAHEDAFRARLPPRLTCVPVEVSPYDFNSTRQRLRKALRHRNDRTVEICVSSGPLAVRTAAMQLARDKDYRASHVTFQECLRIYDASRPQTPPKVVHNTLACYLAERDVGMGNRYPLVTPPYIEVAEYLLAHQDVWGHVITSLRQASDGTTDSRILSIPRSRLQPAHQDILQQLEERQIIADLDRTGNKILLHITEDNWNYLNGHWLEALVFHRLAGLFDDSSCGQQLETPQGSREIDFIGLRDGHFTLVSCKTSGHSYKPAHLEDLQSLSQQIGEPDCLRIYVTDRFKHSPQPGLDYDDFVAFAQAQAIKVIFGDHLNNLREIVGQHLDQQRP